MTLSGYEIVPYRDELLYQVVILQHYLWGGNPDVNVSVFKWKYYDNPYSEKPLGIMALHNGKVVGFRGYFATKWHIPGRDSQFIVLSPTDTIVHPDHRKVGLSVAMGNKAMEEYESKYQVFLNTSSRRTSTPGYTKMGFVPLLERTTLMRYDPLSLMTKKFLLKSKRRAKTWLEDIKTGNFDNFEVSVNPQPAEMAAVHSRQNCTLQRIRLFQDEEFFQWRFNDPRKKHIFYYQKVDNKITAYIVLGLMGNNIKRGIILDYAAKDVEALRETIRFITKTGHADILSINSATLGNEFMQILKGNGFQANSFLGRRDDRDFGLMSYLVRPVKKDCVEKDWYLGGYDIRGAANWEIKGISTI
jgi:hypothetical protein